MSPKGGRKTKEGIGEEGGIGYGGGGGGSGNSNGFPKFLFSVNNRANHPFSHSFTTGSIAISSSNNSNGGIVSDKAGKWEVNS